MKLESKPAGMPGPIANRNDQQVVGQDHCSPPFTIKLTPEGFREFEEAGCPGMVCVEVIMLQEKWYFISHRVVTFATAEDALMAKLKWGGQ